MDRLILLQTCHQRAQYLIVVVSCLFLQFGLHVDAAPADDQNPSEAASLSDAFDKAQRIKDIFHQSEDLVGKGDYAGALVLLKQATELDPSCGICHCDYGLMLKILGQSQAAKEQFLEATRLNRDDFRSWLELWTIYDAEGNSKLADAAYQEYVRLRPDLSEAEKSKVYLRAGDLYARASRFIRQSNFPAAANLLQQSCELEPTSAKYHGDYGLVLHNLGDNEQAIVQLNKAVQSDSKFADGWFYLGTLYAEADQLKLASEALEHYLLLAPQGQMAKIVATLRAEIMEAEQGTSNNDEDYFSSVAKEENVRWPQGKMPLKVYIENGEGVIGVNPEYQQIVRQSFDDWAKASAGKISFVFVKEAGDADIVVHWDITAGPSYRPTDIGATRSIKNTEGISKVTITIVPCMPPPISNTRFKRIVLHEIGHAIGIHCHSPSPADVMYFSAAYSGTASQLSSRDAKTLRLIYPQ